MSEGQREDLLACSPERLKALVTELGQPAYRAGQIFRWLHFQRVTEISQMRNLPAALREALEARTVLYSLRLDLLQRSSDGTCKFRFLSHDGHAVESVYIPEWNRERGAKGRGGAADLSPSQEQGQVQGQASPKEEQARVAGHPAPDRRTLCVSSQVGCAMGCDFCMTATLGLVRNLHAGEMIAQVHAVDTWLMQEGHKGPRPLGNLVFMGMGEPLHNFDALKLALENLLHSDGANFSHRHVTVSTSGLLPALKRLGDETEVKIALSITGTTDEVRDRLMPVNRRYPLAALMEACRALPLRHGRRVTIEYVLLAGVTDSLEDADRLAKLLHNLPAKVNLIAFNEADEAILQGPRAQQGEGPGAYRRPAAKQVEAFRDRLDRAGLTAVIRRSRGRDIDAACGQLAAKAAPSPAPEQD